MRMLFALIGYISTATMLSLVLGFGFLWQTERLDDEKAFQIVALLHGVDLDEVAEEEDPIDEQQAPAEEMSLEQSRVLRQIVLRDHEVKEALLKRNRQEFEYWHAEFKDMRDKLDRIAQQIEQQLNEEGDALAKESIDDVVRKLESLSPAIAKDQLRRTLKEESGIETVITLMNAMDGDKLKKILKTFTTEEELTDLHIILTQMRRGGVQQELFDSYQDDLSGLGRGA